MIKMETRCNKEQHKWLPTEEQYLKSLNKKDIDIYDIAKKLNRSIGSVVSKIQALLGYDFRGNIIGSHKRAVNHYNLILQRIQNTNYKKNKCYKNIKMLISKDDFIKWFMKNDFYNASVDRINKDKDYSLENIQLLPLGENIRKDKVKAKNGLCECYSCHQIKELNLFAKDKRRKNGHSTICKKCDNKRRTRVLKK